MEYQKYRQLLEDDRLDFEMLGKTREYPNLTSLSSTASIIVLFIDTQSPSDQNYKYMVLYTTV